MAYTKSTTKKSAPKCGSRAMKNGMAMTKKPAKKTPAKKKPSKTSMNYGQDYKNDKRAGKRGKKA